MCGKRSMLYCAAGVVPVIGACKALTHLCLDRCTGPFGDELGAAFAGRQALLPLQELHLLGGASALSDPGLLACLTGWVCCTYSSCGSHAAHDSIACESWKTVIPEEYCSHWLCKKECEHPRARPGNGGSTACFVGRGCTA